MVTRKGESNLNVPKNLLGFRRAERQEYGLTYMDTIYVLVGGVTAYLDNTLLRTLTPFPRLITEGIPVGSDSLYVKVYLDLGDYGERKLLYSFTLNSDEFKTIKC